MLEQKSGFSEVVVKKALTFVYIVLVGFSWLLDPVIYLKLRREQLLCKSEQIHKITTVFTQNDNFVHPGLILTHL